MRGVVAALGWIAACGGAPTAPAGALPDPETPPADPTSDLATTEHAEVRTELPRAQVRVEPRRTFRFAAPHARSGAAFREQAEAAGLWAAEPAYGRGATVVDVDEDGLDDLWQGHARNALLGRTRAGVLWRNRGDGTFGELPLGIDPADTVSNWGTTWADLDNDGDADVLFTNGGYDGPGRLSLYRNDLATLGRFTEITDEAGLTDAREAWWGASAADYDRDGWLDLVISARARRYVPPCCRGVPGDPDAAGAAPLLLYHNEGDGTFRSVGDALGLAPGEVDAHNPVWWDFDGDDWLDLFVANQGDWAQELDPDDDFRPDSEVRLYRNLEGAGFVDVTDRLPPQIVHHAPVFVAATLDVDQDGREELYAGRSQLGGVIVHVLDDGTFEARGEAVGIDLRHGWEPHENNMGLGVADLTGDGFPELMIGPGWPWFRGLPIALRHTGRTEGRLYERLGDDFEGAYEGYHHGSAAGDLDQDGDVDAFWNLGGFGLYDADPTSFGVPAGAPTDSRQQPLLMVNHAGSAGRTALIRLQGTRSNRDALGARVRVEGSAVRWVTPPRTNGFQSRNSAWMTIPLGRAASAVVTVDWPSGVRTANRVDADARVWLIEPDEAP